MFEFLLDVVSIQRTVIYDFSWKAACTTPKCESIGVECENAVYEIPGGSGFSDTDTPADFQLSAVIEVLRKCVVKGIERVW